MRIVTNVLREMFTSNICRAFFIDRKWNFVLSVTLSGSASSASDEFPSRCPSPARMYRCADCDDAFPRLSKLFNHQLRRHMSSAGALALVTQRRRQHAAFVQRCRSTTLLSTSDVRRTSTKPKGNQSANNGSSTVRGGRLTLAARAADRPVPGG